MITIKKIVPARLRRLIRFVLLDWRLPAVVRRVVRDGLSYSGGQALGELHAAAIEADAQCRAGELIELGCGSGGSALVIAAAKKQARVFTIYDVFGMPPGPSAQDGPDVHLRWSEIASGRSEGIAGNTYYGYVDNLLDQVKTTFERYGLEPENGNVVFVKGLFEETLTGIGPVALAHIDCDRYESVHTCLQRLAPRMVAGGVMIIDDYDSKSGCKKAVDEFLASDGASFHTVRKSRLHLVRNDR